MLEEQKPAAFILENVDMEPSKTGSSKSQDGKDQPLELSRSSSWHFELEFERMFLKLESPVATGSV